MTHMGSRRGERYQSDLEDTWWVGYLNMPDVDDNERAMRGRRYSRDLYVRSAYALYGLHFIKCYYGSGQ